MKKFLILVIFTFVLLVSACTFISKIKNTSKTIFVNLPPIYTGKANGIFVGVSDPHIYSKMGPKLLSGSYYFNPRSFYRFNKNLSIFLKAYSTGFDGNKVFYYDDKDGVNAAIVVYVLRNVYGKKNVSLRINPEIKSKLKYGIYANLIKSSLFKQVKVATGGYIGSGKYLVVYDPNLIKFKTGDLLLYVCDLGKMKSDSFYAIASGVNIKNFYFSKLIDVRGYLKPKLEIEKDIKKLELKKYRRVFIYYPKDWYKAGLVALYLEDNFER